MQALQIDQLVMFDQVLTPLLKLLASPLGIVMCILLAVFVAIKCKDLLQRSAQTRRSSLLESEALDVESALCKVNGVLKKVTEKRKKDSYKNMPFIVEQMIDDGWFVEKPDGGFISFDGWDYEFENRYSGQYEYKGSDPREHWQKDFEYCRGRKLTEREEKVINDMVAEGWLVFDEYLGDMYGEPGWREEFETRTSDEYELEYTYLEQPESAKKISVTETGHLERTFENAERRAEMRKRNNSASAVEAWIP